MSRRRLGGNADHRPRLALGIGGGDVDLDVVEDRHQEAPGVGGELGRLGGRLIRRAVTLGFLAFGEPRPQPWRKSGSRRSCGWSPPRSGGVPGGTSLVRIITFSTVWTSGTLEEAVGHGAVEDRAQVDVGGQTRVGHGEAWRAGAHRPRAGLSPVLDWSSPPTYTASGRDRSDSPVIRKSWMAAMLLPIRNCDRSALRLASFGGDPLLGFFLRLLRNPLLELADGALVDLLGDLVLVHADQAGDQPAETAARLRGSSRSGRRCCGCRPGPSARPVVRKAV